MIKGIGPAAQFKAAALWPVRKVLQRLTRGEREIQSAAQDMLAVLGGGIAHILNNPLSYVAANSSTAGDYLLELLGVARDPEIPVNAPTPERRDYILEEARTLPGETRDGVIRMKTAISAVKRFFTSEKTVRLNEKLKDLLLLMEEQLQAKVDSKSKISELPALPANSFEINLLLFEILIGIKRTMNPGDDSKILITAEEAEGRIIILFNFQAGKVLPNLPLIERLARQNGGRIILNGARTYDLLLVFPTKT